jgi:hypothetical protein
VLPRYKNIDVLKTMCRHWSLIISESLAANHLIAAVIDNVMILCTDSYPSANNGRYCKSVKL